MSEEFDPDAILNDRITDAEYEGKRPRTPEGSYPDCTITEVRVFEPHEKAKEKGVQARLLIGFECSGNDIDLKTWVNYKRPLNPRSTYTKLLRAVWADAAAAKDKSPGDLVGETVNINVFHEEGDFGEWDEFRFTPAV